MESTISSPYSVIPSAQFAKLGTLNNFTTEYEKFTKFLVSADFGECQEDAKKLLGQLESFNKSLEGVYKADHENLSARLHQACNCRDLKTINLLFTEIKTRVAAESIEKPLGSASLWDRDSGQPSNFLYCYLELLKHNPNRELKQIAFPLLHAAALVDLKYELILCLQFITANEMTDELFLQGDCCFIFEGETEVKLHFYRAVLAQLLPYFQALLNKGMKEATECEIRMSDQSNPMVMKQLLGMLYGSDKCFNMENLLLYLEEASRMNANELIKTTLRCFYKQLKPDHEIDSAILFDFFQFAKEQKVTSLSTFVVYWVVYKIVQGGGGRPNTKGPTEDLLKLLGDNVTHIGNEQYEAMNNNLPQWLVFGTRWITDEELLPLFQCFPKVVSWNLKRYDNITDRTIEYLTTHCKEVEKLDLYCSDKLTDKSLKLIAENLPKLKYLSLDTFNHEKSKFTDRGVIDLLKACSQLLHLVMSDSQRMDVFTSSFYKALQGLSLPLEHFKTPNCHMNFARDSYRNCAEDVITLLKACPNLKDIQINFSEIYLLPEQQNERSRELVEAVMKYCPFVEKLWIEPEESKLNLTQEELQKLLNMPHLHNLNIYLAERMFDPDLLEKGPHLKYVGIRYSTGEWYSYSKPEG